MPKNEEKLILVAIENPYGGLDPRGIMPETKAKSFIESGAHCGIPYKAFTITETNLRST